MDSNVTIGCIHAYVDERRRQARRHQRADSQHWQNPRHEYNRAAVNRVFAKLGLLAYR